MRNSKLANWKANTIENVGHVPEIAIVIVIVIVIDGAVSTNVDEVQS